jgi:hypothetical protein
VNNVVVVAFGGTHTGNYVSRVRKILVRLDIPCDLVNRPGRGYSLTFRNTD